MVARTWHDKAATVGIVLIAVDVCLLLFRWVSFRALYGKHDNLLIASSEIGLVVSVVAFILMLFDKRTIRRVVLVIASLVLGYFCLSSVAWWVMVK
jgi:hypothetical protein